MGTLLLRRMKAIRHSLRIVRQRDFFQVRISCTCALPLVCRLFKNRSPRDIWICIRGWMLQDAYHLTLLHRAGCHVPPLCIGMEYAKTGNLQVSDQFFSHTLSICAMDPLVFNEIGVLRYLQVKMGLHVECSQLATKTRESCLSYKIFTCCVTIVVIDDV